MLPILHIDYLLSYSADPIAQSKSEIIMVLGVARDVVCAVVFMSKIYVKSGFRIPEKVFTLLDQAIAIRNRFFPWFSQYGPEFRMKSELPLESNKYLFDRIAYFQSEIPGWSNEKATANWNQVDTFITALKETVTINLNEYKDINRPPSEELIELSHKTLDFLDSSWRYVNIDPKLDIGATFLSVAIGLGLKCYRIKKEVDLRPSMNREIRDRNLSGDPRMGLLIGLEQVFDSLKDQCSACKAPTRSKCGRCQLSRYCSRECQKKEWVIHKVLCGKVSLEDLREEIALGPPWSDKCSQKLLAFFEKENDKHP